MSYDQSVENRELTREDKAKEYSVLVIASPTVPIRFLGTQSPSYRFNIKGTTGVKEVVLHNVEANDLHFIAHVTANSINDAIDEAIPQVRGIVSNFVYLLSSRIPFINPIVAWESDPQDKGDYVQFVSPVPVKNPEKQSLQVKDIRRWLAILNDKEDEITYQVTRAVRWYRNSLLTESAIEKLIFLWIGFEAIDPLLCKLLHIKPEMLTCDNCNHEYSTKSNQGIRKWIEKLQQEKTVPSRPSFNEIRSARGKLVHAGSRLVKNENEWRFVAELLGKALLLALDDISGLDTSLDRIDDSKIEQLVRVRIDGQISQKKQRSQSGIPPMFVFLRGTGFITMQSQEPHIWKIPEPLERLSGSDFTISVDTISTTFYNSILPQLKLELN